MISGASHREDPEVVATANVGSEIMGFRPYSQI